MNSMTEVHRMFLQGLMSRKSGTEKDVKELLKVCVTKCGGNRLDLDAVVNTINANISPVHMEIKKGVNEITGVRHYALVNLCDSPVALLSSDYVVNELEFFKKIVEAIMTEAENGEISSTLALNAVDRLEKRYSKKDAQELIERFVKDNWLVKSKKGGLSLHVRAMIELDHYIRQVYPDDIIVCDLCKQLVMKGRECTNCEARLHFHCADRLTQDAARAKCPKCKAKWVSNN